MYHDIRLGYSLLPILGLGPIYMQSLVGVCNQDTEMTDLILLLNSHASKEGSKLSGRHKLAARHNESTML